MKKRTVALMIPVAALIAAIATFAVLEAQRPPNWQFELNRYLESTASPSETVTVKSVVPAQQPQNFTPDMASAVLTGWEWKSISIPPPRDIQCVLLERTRHSTATAEVLRLQEVVLVGFHSDLMWHEGWIVHELTSDLSTPKSQEILTALGCNLGLTFSPTASGK
jgi:hypothetical protein